jgi:hypothetical protein
MTTITLEVPDELAARVTRLQGRLPDLLARALRLESGNEGFRSGDEHPNPALYREIIDFLASDPLPKELAAFKISRDAQARLEDLLEKNREEELTPEETAEIDAYLQARDLLIFLKANARSEMSF